MISASLCVIGLIVGLLFNYQQKSKEAEIRSQGVGLVRLLAEIPYEQLVPDNGCQGVLQVMYQSQNNSDFAYGVIQDTQGEPLTQVTQPGVIIPAAKLSAEPASWLGERMLAPGSDGRALLEFHAPLITRGELIGYIRLGYFRPDYGLSYEQIPFSQPSPYPYFCSPPYFIF